MTRGVGKSIARGEGESMLSTMHDELIDETNSARIARLGTHVLAGGELNRADARWLFNLEESADIFDLLAWANRIREKFKGNKIHLCSIVNIKAGGCSENCRFCAQSASYQTDSPRYNLVESEPVRAASEEAKSNGVTAVGLVALTLYRYLKSHLARQRPYLQHGGITLATAPLDRYSFPSGHTLHAVSFTLVALSYYPELAPLLVPFAVLVAMSRVILGLHYPSDVMAGALLGALLARASWLLLG